MSWGHIGLVAAAKFWLVGELSHPATSPQPPPPAQGRCQKETHSRFRLGWSQCPTLYTQVCEFTIMAKERHTHNHALFAIGVSTRPSVCVSVLMRDETAMHCLPSVYQLVDLCECLHLSAVTSTHSALMTMHVDSSCASKRRLSSEISGWLL